ncbi:hypothetical protein LINGRAHAP2_LOCUS17679, partial [Linum grandiflorum]
PIDWVDSGNEGWFRSPTKVADAGGVIHIDIDRFVKAFVANLGSCSITRTEMRAIVDVMQLAWSLSIRWIQLQSNSMAAVAKFNKVSDLDHQHAAVVLQFNDLCIRQWEVHFSHIYREFNSAAVF